MAPVRSLKNKALLCKPMSQNKGTSCKPHTQTAETQTGTCLRLPAGGAVLPTQVSVCSDQPFCAPPTDEVEPKVIILPVPVPVPIFVPIPLHLYSQYTPFPLGLPVPVRWPPPQRILPLSGPFAPPLLIPCAPLLPTPAARAHDSAHDVGQR